LSTALADITSESLEQLSPEWAALHARTTGATPFSHPAWAETWLRHFGSVSGPNLAPLAPSPPRPLAAPDHAVFLSVRLDNELVGVCSLDPDQDVACQLGDHNVCDYTGLLAAPGHEAMVAAGVIEWLMEDLTAGLDLWGVPEASPLRLAFAAAAERFGWTCAEEHEAVAPATELGADFETYVSGLSKHDRHELRRKLRNLGAAGEVAFESVTGSAEIEGRFDRFLELMRVSRDGKDEFLTPTMEAFFRDLAATFADLGLVRLSTLKLDGNDVAMVFAFENASTTFLYNSGYDPAFAHLAVGLLSKAEAIRDAIARDKRTFDFLRGEEEYKKRLGGEPRQVLRLRLRQG
jgi:CelD/BcsL family acetyltransferase involved in cellulose biosynthesis